MMVDKETGEELIGATVKIKGTSIGCVTDIDGNFILKTDLPFPLDLEVSYMGYQLYNITVNSSEEKLKIKLVNSSTELETVEVSSGISEKIKERSQCNINFTLKNLGMELNDLGFIKRKSNGVRYYNVVLHEERDHLKKNDFLTGEEGYAF